MPWFFITYSSEKKWLKSTEGKLNPILREKENFPLNSNKTCSHIFSYYARVSFFSLSPLYPGCEVLVLPLYIWRNQKAQEWEWGRRGGAETRAVLPAATLQKKGRAGVRTDQSGCTLSCFNTYCVAGGHVPSPDKLIISLVPSLTVRRQWVIPTLRWALNQGGRPPELLGGLIDKW